MSTLTSIEKPSVTRGVLEHQEHGLTVLSPVSGRPRRRVLYVNSYGGADFWKQIKRGWAAPHHLWGCLELVRMGYEVALAEPLPDFYLYRNPLPHDLRLLRVVRSWLGTDGIVYCGHNVLYWLPFLRSLGLLRSRIISLLYAREPLDLGGAHCGIIALTGAAAEQARQVAPRAKVAHLGWGADLSVFPQLPYDPQWFLSCGRTRRDPGLLCAAAARSGRLIRVIGSRVPARIAWPSNVQFVPEGASADAVSYPAFLHDQYARCAASLIVLQSDPGEHTAVGLTNLIEAMAMARPVIVTRTGALPTEIDVERTGCGLQVPPDAPDALAQAIEDLATHRHQAEAMGKRGRALCEARYNITRYAADLHQFFETL
jgi:glycosyltransferase involved in cell wall biosynthesis